MVTKNDDDEPSRADVAHDDNDKDEIAEIPLEVVAVTACY